MPRTIALREHVVRSSSAARETVLKGAAANSLTWSAWRTAAFPASRRSIALNYAAGASLVILGLALYYVSPFHQRFFSGVGYAALGWVAAAYLVLLPLFYATFPDDYTVKCRLFWRAIAKLPRRRPSAQEAVALRAVLVKAFFLPLMLNWLVLHVISIYETRQTFGTASALAGGYAILLSFLILLDVLVFTVGYGVEHPRLGNEIRSVEPTLLGWIAALACYPPFFLITLQALIWPSEDHPAIANPWVQAGLFAIMLLLMGIYTWASAALGLKASNLTHRGVVQSGPYAWVRHPAYVAKNLFWWCGMLPWILTAAATDRTALVAGIVGMLGCNGIYCLRAWTEERHLGADPAYQEYRRRTPWWFIPGVW
ncbi:MAG: DUF1295 domain-containing protein [Planctomycetes bacterium]|nr:DUF1295 domain-containing protein [Planctomycetota bacterium]